MPLLKSGDCLRIGPERGAPEDMVSLHLISDAFFILRHFGAVETTFEFQEEKELGGNRRYYPIGLPRATWTLPYACIVAIQDLFDLIEFTYLDCPVTMRTWTGFEYKNYSATFHYDPRPELRRDNFEEKYDIVFEFFDLEEIA